MTNNVLIVLQALAIGFMRDLFGSLHCLLGRAIFQNDLQRSFRAYARRAGNVIDRVAHQAEQVDDLVGRDSEFILDPFLIAPFDWRHGHFAFHVRRILPHGDDVWVGDELAQVFVVRDNDGLHLFLLTLLRERSDDVVRFIAIETKVLDPERLANLLNIRQL